ncbi:hypothetical protein KAX06_08025 [candidate division WOR-3 bacterium]|nr:hypothetical protein [candidate division WOR-3 bacterium]
MPRLKINMLQTRQVYIALVTIMGSPQEREAILWGKKKAGQKVVKSSPKGGQKVDNFRGPHKDAKQICGVKKRGISGENGEILGYFEGSSLVFLFHNLLNYIIRKQID